MIKALALSLRMAAAINRYLSISMVLKMDSVQVLARMSVLKSLMTLKKGRQAYNVVYLDRQFASIKTKKPDQMMSTVRPGNQSGFLLKFLG